MNKFHHVFIFSFRYFVYIFVDCVVRLITKKTSILVQIRRGASCNRDKRVHARKTKTACFYFENRRPDATIDCRVIS